MLRLISPWREIERCAEFQTNFYFSHTCQFQAFFILYAVLSHASFPAIYEMEQEGGRCQTQLIGDRFWCCQLVEVYCVTSVFSYMNHKS